MTTKPETSTLRTMLAVLAIALVVAFISSTLVLAGPHTPSSWQYDPTTLPMPTSSSSATS